MMKIMAEKWGRNSQKLKEALFKVNASSIEYENLAALTFNIIWNDPDELCTVCTPAIEQLGERGYSGDLVFVVPTDSDEIEPGTFFLTYISYGSCSGCDALYSIKDDIGDVPPEQTVEDLMLICKDLACNTTYPFNHGCWYKASYCHTDDSSSISWKKAITRMERQEYNDPLHLKSEDWKEGWYAAKNLMIECVNDVAKDPYIESCEDDT